jgi:PAS domain-containing protein
VVAGFDGDQVYTLQGADYPYRMLVEQMSEGALSLTMNGDIIYANRRLAQMLKMPLEQVIGARFERWIAPADQATYWALLNRQSPHTSHYGVVSPNRRKFRQGSCSLIERGSRASWRIDGVPVCWP